MIGNPERLCQIASGELRGLRFSVARGILRALSVAYGAAVWVRGRCYGSGLFARRKVGRPVISVGNITVGGTGKTPLAGWLCRKLREAGRSPAVLTRGYGADEVELLERYSGAPVHVGVDRAELAERVEGADCLVLDDGFQYLRLRRDVDLVLMDATNPFGFGALLPRGLLREPVASLGRADAILLTRVDLSDAPEAVASQIERVAGKRPIAWVRFRPAALLSADGRDLGLDWLRGKRVGAFCGIGNPSAFYRTLERLGAEVVLRQSFRDHHWFAPEELDRLARETRRLRADLTVTTEKDAIRIRPPVPEGLCVLRNEVEFVSGEGELVSLVMDGIRRASQA